MIEGWGFWGQYLAAMCVLVVVARALWLARRDEREARLWSKRRECLRALDRMSK